MSINSQPRTIENGYFVFTLMPSLYCQFNCKHCYLSLEQRRNKEIMTIESLEKIVIKVRDYYRTRNVQNKTIVAYFYGGEPTSMGVEYFEQVFNVFKKYFHEKEGYTVRNVILSSLIDVDIAEWKSILQLNCDSYIQTSYDGLMRGKNYLKKWEKKVKEFRRAGIQVATISVVNSELIKVGGDDVISYLTELGIKETGWLPFMLNEQNTGDKYDKYAPTMTAFNDFMIDLSTKYEDIVASGGVAPMVGELDFILTNGSGGSLSNLAAQTLFMLPDGTLCLPDYREGWKEYFNEFGNILHPDTSFDDILTSVQRRKYLLRQVRRNGNPECKDCGYSNRCLIEFAKPNKPNDECFGGKRFIKWALEKTVRSNIVGNIHY